MDNIKLAENEPIEMKFIGDSFYINLEGKKTIELGKTKNNMAQFNNA
jgi:hypothetical protein